MSTTQVVCDNPKCHKKFLKENKEINRSKKLGRRQYCCLSCYGDAEGKGNLLLADPKKVAEARRNIVKYCGSKRDKYTPFRFFMKVATNQNREKNWGNIDLKYLKQLWEEQQGICPLSGWKLDLPNTAEGWKTARNGKRASLDRIDNSKGYIKGNVRYISFMANIAQNNMSDEELIEFCKAVVNNEKDYYFR